MAITPTFSIFSPAQGFRKLDDGSVVFDPTLRRHPWYNLFQRHWRFMLESYQGGPEYNLKGMHLGHTPGQASAQNSDVNVTNLFPYFKEGTEEYRQRLLRSHRKNYSRNVVDKIRAFLARKPPARRTEVAPEELRVFWKNVDGKGRNIDRYMAMAMQWAMVFGEVWIQVNKPEEVFESAEQELVSGMPFARFVFPFDMLDAGLDDRGRLKWVMIQVLRRRDDDPMRPSPLVRQFEIWDRETVRTLETVAATDTTPASFRMVDERMHGLGFVPFHSMKYSESENPFAAPGLLDDIAYIDRSIFNHQSQLDTIILDQTFSQLAIPADAVILNSPTRQESGTGTVVSSDNNARTRQRILEMGTKRVFLFNGNASQPPRYISPDATQATVVMSAIKESRDEIFRIAALLGEVGREVRTQTGVSKAYDFDKLNKVLSFIAQEAQLADFWLSATALAWLSSPGSARELPEDLVKYPENFDIMGLLEMLDIAFRSDELDLHSPTAQSMVREQLVDKMFPGITPQRRAQIMREIALVLERNQQMLERAPLDPTEDPDQDPERDEALGRDPSQVRGAGGGARRPGAGQPTRPTQQQGNRNDATQVR